MSTINILFSRFEGTRGAKTQMFRTQEVAFNSIPQNPETSKVPTLSDESYDCETKTETKVIENNVMQEKQSEEINCDSDSSYYEIECSICQARFLDQKCMNEHIAKKHVFLST